MSRFAFGFLLGAALAVGGGVATVAVARDGGFSLPRMSGPARETGPVTVVLHRDGGRVFAGPDDSSLRLSGILLRQGIGYADVPAFRGTDAEWDRLVRCVERKYEGYGVNVVERAPENGDYMLAMVGGLPEQFGFAETVGGIAPHKGSVIEEAVLFIFQPTGRTMDVMCDTAAHEIGHAIGLDHSRLCSDIMSYEACGPRAFRDEAARCGEWEDRDCDGGRATQNSARQLVALVGRRAEPVAVVSPPLVASVDPRVRATVDPVAGRPFQVQVEVDDPSKVEFVDLYWYGQRGTRLRCGEESAAIDFGCKVDGGTFRFTLTPGQGRRKYVVRVTEDDGKAWRTAAADVTFR